MIEVLEAGLLTSVQDVTGRVAWRHLGVPVGGALDPWSARAANRLVGNHEDDALLECTLAGPTLRFDVATRVAIVGRLDATVDGLPLPPAESRLLRRGSVLRVADGPDARAWVAIGGGIDVPVVLGGRGTDLRAGYGGWQGRALRAGDRLPIAGPGASAAVATGPRWRGTWGDGPIRVVAGPDGSDEVIAALSAGTWRVSPASDRTGVRLEGPVVPGGEVASMGLPLGAVQVPPDGAPIVCLADRPVTGGYRVPVVVIAADVGRIARLRPGDELVFSPVSREAALAARAVLERDLDRIG